MHRLIQLSLMAGLSACAAPRPEADPGSPAAPQSVRPAGDLSSQPQAPAARPREASFATNLTDGERMNRSAALYEEAWSASLAGDRDRAQELFEESLMTLGSTNPRNATEKRYRLIENLALFASSRLRLVGEGPKIWERAERAYALFEEESLRRGRPIRLRRLPRPDPGKEMEVPDFRNFRTDQPVAEPERATTGGEPSPSEETAPGQSQFDRSRTAASGAAPLPGGLSIDRSRGRQVKVELGFGPGVGTRDQPASLEHQLLLAEHLMATGNLEEAQELLERLLRDLDASGDEISESAVRVHQLLAALLASTGNTDGAQVHEQWLAAANASGASPADSNGAATPAPSESSEWSGGAGLNLDFLNRWAEALRAKGKRANRREALFLGWCYWEIGGQEGQAGEFIDLALNGDDVDGSLTDDEEIALNVNGER